MAAEALVLLSKPNIIEKTLLIIDDLLLKGVTYDFLLKFLKFYIFLSINGQETQETKIFRYIDETVIQNLVNLFNSIIPLYIEKGYRPSEVFIAMLIYFFINTQSRADLVQGGLGMHLTSGHYVSKFMTNFLRLTPTQTGIKGSRTFHYGTFLKQVNKLLGSPSEGFTEKTAEEINEIYHDFLKRRSEELGRTEAGEIINRYYQEFLEAPYWEHLVLEEALEEEALEKELVEEELVEEELVEEELVEDSSLSVELVVVQAGEVPKGVKGNQKKLIKN